MASLLLQNGIVLLHDDKDHVNAQTADILIHGNTITTIKRGISAPKGCRIIDCSNKIVSPGFVDTHNHMWETPLKGHCENLTAISYFATMFTASSAMSVSDVFWGTLAGCVQSIDAGTTTTLDYAHMNWTEEHGPHALAATLTSGIRSVFAYAPSIRIKRTDPEVEFENLLPDWFMASLRKLSLVETFNTTSPRVRLALGFDFFFLGRKVVQEVIDLAHSLKLQLITSHWTRAPGSTTQGLPELLKTFGLEQDRVVISHFGKASAKDCEILNEEKKWYVSSSPSVEMSLGLGPPVCFGTDPAIADASCSLGVDCHCASSASMVNEMRTALLASRGADASSKLCRGFVPGVVSRTAHDAYLMGTIRGARALGVDHEVGSIAVGKKADLVIFDALSPAMAPAAQHDPVTSIVMHSSTGDIETVIVDGVIRKENGKLRDVNLIEWDRHTEQFLETKHETTWRHIALKVIEIQARFASNLLRFDLDKLKTAVSSLYGFKEPTE